MMRCWLQCRRVALSAISGRKAQHVASKEEFNEKVLNSPYPVVVNFHAEWCDPCKVLTPKLEALIEPLSDVDLVVVDVEKNPELVENFEVRGVPAVVALRSGDVVDKFIGLMEEETMERLVEKLKLGNDEKGKEGSHVS